VNHALIKILADWHNENPQAWALPVGLTSEQLGKEFIEGLATYALLFDQDREEELARVGQSIAFEPYGQLIADMVRALGYEELDALGQQLNR
jgi:hypothetical protein